MTGRGDDADNDSRPPTVATNARRWGYFFIILFFFVFFQSFSNTAASNCSQGVNRITELLLFTIQYNLL
jgi:hypothetical protein